MSIHRTAAEEYQARQHIVALENRALRMLHAGDRAQEVASTVGLTVDHVRQLQRDFPSTATARCPQPKCAQPQEGPGHPRRGWIQVRANGVALWFCTWPCVSRHVQQQLRQQRTGGTP